MRTTYTIDKENSVVFIYEQEHKPEVVPLTETFLKWLQYQFITNQNPRSEWIKGVLHIDLWSPDNVKEINF